MGKPLLLVDDDAQILDTAQDILETAGFEVRTAGTGADALKSLREHPCRVMIVDFNLPDTTGVDLAVQAKTLVPGIVVFLMTGESHVNLGASQGAIQATLIKPVDPSELIALLHRNS